MQLRAAKWLLGDALGKHPPIERVRERTDNNLLGSYTYLAFIAFLPLPIALLNRYSDQPITVVLYITTLLLISLMELVLFGRAHRNRLFASQPPARVIRYSALVIMLPVIVFMLAIPVGLLSSPTYALAVWILLNFPLRILIERRLGPTAHDPFL